MVGGLPRHRIGRVDVTDLILHIPYQIRTDEARGHGPLEVGHGRIVAANALARYATNLAASGGMPHCAAGPSRRARPTTQAERPANGSGSATAWRRSVCPAVLSGGVDFKTLSFDPEKMALVDLSRLNEARIAYPARHPRHRWSALPSGQDSLHVQHDR